MIFVGIIQTHFKGIAIELVVILCKRQLGMFNCVCWISTPSSRSLTIEQSLSKERGLSAQKATPCGCAGHGGILCVIYVINPKTSVFCLLQDRKTRKFSVLVLFIFILHYPINPLRYNMINRLNRNGFYDCIFVPLGFDHSSTFTAAHFLVVFLL